MTFKVSLLRDLNVPFETLRAQWEKNLRSAQYFQTKSFCDYYQLYFGSAYELGFLGITGEGENPLAGIVPFTLNAAKNEISYFNHGIDAVWFCPPPTGDGIRAVHEEVFRLLTSLMGPGCSLKLGDLELAAPTRDQLSYREEVFCKFSLAPAEEQLYRGVRKSYRSLINWGKREMRVEVIDASNPDLSAMEAFREFHIRVAGRETRSKASWDKQFEMLKNGEAFLVLAHLQGALVSGALNFFTPDECFYGVAVNDRDLMGKKVPIGHWVIMKSILMAKERGVKCYNLGLIGPETAFSNPKEASIGLFKSGFGDAKALQRHAFFIAKNT